MGTASTKQHRPATLPTRVNSPKKGSPHPWGGVSPPQPQNFRIFATYGRWKAGSRRKMMPRGLASFSTPGEPIPGNCFFRPFSGYFDPPWIFDFGLPMTIPWDLGSNRVAHLVHGSTRLQHGHSGFLGKALRAFETRTSTLVLRAFENPNSVGAPYCYSRTLGAGGLFQGCSTRTQGEC